MARRTMRPSGNGTNMVRNLEGKLNAEGLRFAVVLGRFNDLLGEKLLSGALDCLRRHGAAEDSITVARVPGTWEIPQVVRRLARTRNHDAIVALGVAIRGATPHFEVLTSASARELQEAARESGVPVTFGIVTADSLEQAIERCGAKQGNKGWSAALAAIEMADLFRSLPSK